MRRELGLMERHECEICSAAGMVTEATQYAVGRWLCDSCADQYRVYLRPGERLKEVTREEMDRRIYSNP